MKYNDNDIASVVKFINEELAKGRTMIDIENKEFNVNERVMTKRLKRKGYTKINNQFVFKEGSEAQKEVNKINKVIPNNKNVKQKYNNDINKENLEELISLLGPIKEVIQEYNKSKTFVEGEPIELKVKKIAEVKQKLFKIDTEILEEWEQFVTDHKQFKVQNLISLALEEFINKYK
jgi:hypothetical protein